MVRHTAIILMSLALVAVIADGHQSQAKAQSADVEHSTPAYLKCEGFQLPEGGIAKTDCKPVSLESPSSEQLKDAGEKVAGTASSLWVAHNLATEESTKKWLTGVLGEPRATKVAPEIFRTLKSRHTGHAILGVIAVGGLVYVYETLFGGPEPVFKLQAIFGRKRDMYWLDDK